MTGDRVLPTVAAVALAVALGAGACGGADRDGAPAPPQVTVLSPEEAGVVTAVEAVTDDGFTISSAVCEAVHPRPYRRADSVFGGKQVFHAFRLTGRDIAGEATVLFASNHAAADGGGVVIPVNPAAVDLDQGFPPGTDLADPITEDMAGAPEALACAAAASPAPPAG